MKKLILVLVLFSFFFTSAQIEFKPGIKAGLNSTNITNFDADAKTDFYAGAFMVIKFAKFYNLQPEIVYSRQGSEVNFNGNSADLELDYLTIVIANKFFPFKGLGLHAMIGPSIDIKMNDNFSSAVPEPEGFDFAIFGGLGYELPFGLSVEVRYKQGFIDIFGQNVNNTVSIDELFANKVIQVGVTYQFDL